MIKVPAKIQLSVSAKNAVMYTGIILLFLFLFLCFEFYMPLSPASNENATFAVEKGWSNDQIANNLKSSGLIRSAYFFKLYAILSFKHIQMQAGNYTLSPRMSLHQIANALAHGDVIKNELVILEGWDTNDIAQYIESRGVCSQEDFIYLTKKDYSENFDFLVSKPKKLNLEGFLFPDTYQISDKEDCRDVVNLMLVNLGDKLIPEIREEIKKQNKTIFEIITMASLIEKEVRTMEDKKIVSGILWKRISIGMPLQLDSTVNYVTGKSDPAVSIKDTQVDSPYNTYKYRGLPKGPISNPGIDSIMAAIYPTKTNYLYYLSDGRTIFSKTFEEHSIAKAKYLND